MFKCCNDQLPRGTKLVFCCCCFMPFHVTCIKLPETQKELLLSGEFRWTCDFCKGMMANNNNEQDHNKNDHHDPPEGDHGYAQPRPTRNYPCENPERGPDPDHEPQPGPSHSSATSRPTHADTTTQSLTPREWELQATQIMTHYHDLKKSCLDIYQLSWDQKTSIFNIVENYLFELTKKNPDTSNRNTVLTLCSQLSSREMVELETKIKASLQVLLRRQRLFALCMRRMHANMKKMDTPKKMFLEGHVGKEIVIYGINESENEDLNKILFRIANRLHMKLEAQDVQFAVRVRGCRASTQPRMVVIRLASRALRDSLVRAARRPANRHLNTKQLSLPGPIRRIILRKREKQGMPMPVTPPCDNLNPDSKKHLICSILRTAAELNVRNPHRHIALHQFRDTPALSGDM